MGEGVLLPRLCTKGPQKRCRPQAGLVYRWVDGGVGTAHTLPTLSGCPMLCCPRASKARSSGKICAGPRCACCAHQLSMELSALAMLSALLLARAAGEPPAPLPGLPLAGVLLLPRLPSPSAAACCLSTAPSRRMPSSRSSSDALLKDTRRYGLWNEGSADLRSKGRRAGGSQDRHNRGAKSARRSCSSAQRSPRTQAIQQLEQGQPTSCGSRTCSASRGQAAAPPWLP